MIATLALWMWTAGSTPGCNPIVDDCHWEVMQVYDDRFVMHTTTDREIELENNVCDAYRLQVRLFLNGQISEPSEASAYNSDQNQDDIHNMVDLLIGSRRSLTADEIVCLINRFGT